MQPSRQTQLCALCSQPCSCGEAAARPQAASRTHPVFPLSPRPVATGLEPPSLSSVLGPVCECTCGDHSSGHVCLYPLPHARALPIQVSGGVECGTE